MTTFVAKVGCLSCFSAGSCDCDPKDKTIEELEARVKELEAKIVRLEVQLVDASWAAEGYRSQLDAAEYGRKW